VRIKAELTTREGLARVDIYDDGPGLSPEQANSLFEPFRRATSGGGGRGLGLWICKVIVEAHGGRIGITCGSTGGHFWFELPTAA
jgi:signal transduction histidine kinase